MDFQQYLTLTRVVFEYTIDSELNKIRDNLTLTRVVFELASESSGVISILI